jgi:hypothetical protein
MVRKRLMAINRMLVHENTVIFFKSYDPTTSRTPSMLKCRFNKMASRVLLVLFKPNLRIIWLYKIKVNNIGSVGKIQI